MAEFVVTIFTRDGCGSCAAAIDTARTELAQLGPSSDVRIELVDVDSDEAIRDRYGMAVPVVMVDDVEISRYGLAPGDLRDHLRRLASDGHAPAGS